MTMTMTMEKPPQLRRRSADNGVLNRIPLFGGGGGGEESSIDSISKVGNE